MFNGEVDCSGSYNVYTDGGVDSSKYEVTKLQYENLNSLVINPGESTVTSGGSGTYISLSTDGTINWNFNEGSDAQKVIVWLTEISTSGGETTPTYTITQTWKEEEGILDVSGPKEGKDDEKITLTVTLKDGYTDPTWIINDGTQIQNLSGNEVTFTLYANTTVYVYAIVKAYNITYDLDGGTLKGENLSTYYVTTNTFTLIEPTKTGYIFDGWTGSNGTTPQRNLSITKGTTGDLNYKANWVTENSEYTISVDKGNGIDDVQPTKGYIGQQVTLTATVKNGYSDVKWEINGVEYTTNPVTFKLETGMIIKVSATPIEYKITYNLDGGTANGNPEKYTVETEDITLNKPIKTGYKFTGWTESGETIKQESVTISKGSTGDREYTANWEVGEEKLAKYTIEYYKQQLDGSYSSTPDDTTTGEDVVGNRVPSEVKEYKGFVTPNSITEVIKEDGSTIVKYYYERKTYTIKMVAGTGVNTVSGGGTYKFGQEVELSATLMNGYTNVKYKIDEGEIKNKFEMPASDLNVTAEAEAIKYTITYDLAGGSITGETKEYTIEDADFSLPVPTRTGYTFTGWTGSNGTTPQKQVTISKGTTGDKKYTANWTKETSGESSELELKVSYSPTEKTNDKVIVTITSNKELVAVVGWTLSSDKKTLTKEYTSNKTETVAITSTDGEKQNVNVSVSIIDKVAPTVTVTYKTSGNKVIVTITSDEELQPLSGWTLSSDKRTLTRTYVSSSNEKITVKDVAGNESVVNVEVQSTSNSSNNSNNGTGSNTNTNTNSGNLSSSSSSSNKNNSSSTGSSVNSSNKNSSSSVTSLPNTGKTYFVVGFVIAVLGAGVAFIKYRRLKDVK